MPASTATTAPLPSTALPGPPNRAFAEAQPAPAPGRTALAPNSESAAAPPVVPHIVLLPPEQPPRHTHEAEEADLIWGLGALVLLNTHYLDPPSNRAVSVGSVQGSDSRYPGFLGYDATLGLMFDLRYVRHFGLEVDLFRQLDRGEGVIQVVDTGSVCFIPNTPLPYLAKAHTVRLGQPAWHLPVLFKLAIPSRKVVVRRGDEEHAFRRSYSTLALGPEFVFPAAASLEVAPSGSLDYPLRATASTYTMITGALGFEQRLLDSLDIRLLFSVRASYNPAVGSSVAKRGEYVVAGTEVVPVAYRSEWRYQAGVTLGAGWFF